MEKPERQGVAAWKTASERLLEAKQEAVGQREEDHLGFPGPTERTSRA